jgi:hypothetical protein
MLKTTFPSVAAWQQAHAQNNVPSVAAWQQAHAQNHIRIAIVAPSRLRHRANSIIETGLRVGK